MTQSYREFLEAKKPVAIQRGPSISVGELHPALSPHARDIVRWAIPGGRRAIFAKFGLHKTRIQLEICRRIIEKEGGSALISAPLGVRLDFKRDAEALDIDLNFGRTDAEMVRSGINITNHESIREGKIDLNQFTVLDLDEAAVLRDTGSKTFREFYRQSMKVPYRFVATAVPDPNEHIEILNYAMVLGVMDIGEAKTRFFRRNSEKSDQLTLHPHKVEEFWLWVSTWAVFLQRPSDLGHSDEGYELPPLDVHWHAVHDGQIDAGAERDGQGRMFHDASMGISDQSRAARASLDARIAKVKQIVEQSPDDKFIIWHHLEDERRALEAAIPGLVTVYGSQDLDERERLIEAFVEGRIQYFGAKPSMLGSGPNFQHHCHRGIYAGVDDKFNQFIQSAYRLHRFQQKHRVRLDIVHAQSQLAIVRRMREDWKRHDETTERTSDLIRKHGLSHVGALETLSRSIGVSRREERGEMWTAINNDTVEETAAVADNTFGLTLTSIPFSTQYEYTPSYNDFGHTDDEAHFFAQMDFLSPHLLRTLKPGRMLCVHVKDRVRPGGYDNRGFQSVCPFHAQTILHYMKHGFVYMGMITVVTDVVRENNQTYRLGWSEQCKDGSRMGVGLPEYVLLFRKEPTDASSGYADERVEKTKEEYSRARWQIDAHAFWKSRGDRLLEPSELVGHPWKQVFNRFRGFTCATVYHHEHAVELAEAMDEAGQLPPDFMLLQPGTDHPDVWCDVARMRGLNSFQQAHGREKHLCPLPFDIVDRLINRFSNPGDVVFDPFAGLFTVPLRAVKLGRRGRGHELNGAYFEDGVRYHRAADEKKATPTLFDTLEAVA